jgi:hypothetical protein
MNAVPITNCKRRYLTKKFLKFPFCLFLLLDFFILIDSSPGPPGSKYVAKVFGAGLAKLLIPAFSYWNFFYIDVAVAKAMCVEHMDLFAMISELIKNINMPGPTFQAPML